MSRHGLDVKIGHDAGRDQSGSVTMKRYRSRGTPWTVVIDRKGIVRFNAFHLETDSAVSLIDELLRS